MQIPAGPSIECLWDYIYDGPKVAKPARDLAKATGSGLSRLCPGSQIEDDAKRCEAIRAYFKRLRLENQSAWAPSVAVLKQPGMARP